MMLELEIGNRIDKKLDEPARVPSINYEPPLIDGLLPPLKPKKLQTPTKDFAISPAQRPQNQNTAPNPKKAKQVKATTPTPETIATTEKTLPATEETVAITPRPTASSATPATITTTITTTTESIAAISPGTTYIPQSTQDTDAPHSTASTPSVPKSTAPLQMKPNPNLLTRIPVPFDSVLRMLPPASSQNDYSNSACCIADENTPKLVLPISMKHLVKQEGSCESFAKIVIPIDGLSPENLRSLSSISVNELIKRVLESIIIN